MQVRILVSADASALHQFLAPYCASSMFMLSNLAAAGIGYNGLVNQGEYLGAFDKDGLLCGVFVHYWNGNLMMQAPGAAALQQLIEQGKTYFKRSVVGVLGPDDQALFVIEHFLKNESFTINSSEGLYELPLDTFSEVTSVPEYMLVEACEVPGDLLARWMRAYEIEALGSCNDDRLNDRVRARVEAMKKGNCWSLLFQGVPVSLCGLNACVGSSVQFGPVWTPPENRNKGYARVLLRFLLQELKKRGVIIAYLFTNAPAAIRVYEAVGFRKIGTYRLAIVK
ncbi:MAG: hypothetical protein QG632_875 [Candidatus Dependentiae bacterium]|nr:hypothetical protein [Candidatus Dependentiae bacterium]